MFLTISETKNALSDIWTFSQFQFRYFRKSVSTIG